MIRLLAIDIDGTLLDGRGRLPDAHRDALVDAAARGLEIVLVTGRTFHFSHPIVLALPIPLTLIVNNGALVKDRDGGTRMRHLLARDAAAVVLESTRAYEDSVAIVFDRSDDRQIVFDRMDWLHPHRRGYYERNRQFIAEASPLAATLTEDPIQVMFNGYVAPMRELVAVLRAIPSEQRFSVSVTEYEHRDFSLVDVNGAGCSKGATLARWVESRGLTSKEVLAAGDNLNDLDMLEYAGTAVMMGNASAAVRARLPHAHVTLSNDEDGLALAIRTLASS